MMAHRYMTRSSTPTIVIDLTQDPPRRRSNPVQRRNHPYRIPPTIPDPADRLVNLGESTENITEDSVDKYTLPTIDDVPLPCLNTSFSGIPEVLTCPICFEPLSASRGPTATRCGHVFCKGCLTASLKNCKRCPKCQTVVAISTSIRLYF